MENRFRAHVDELVADAEAQAGAGDWEAARSLAEAALALDSDDTRARHVLRTVQTAMGRTGERRLLTVMFTDVVGSTELSGMADPEVVREIFLAYQGTCTSVIDQYGGHVAAYIGDGIVAYFGHPTPHEDDPVRSVHAGLDMLDGLKEVGAWVDSRFGLPFAVRIAVHTGLVVRAEMGAPGRRIADAVVGMTPNVAARLQTYASPNSLIVSSSTRDLLRGSFVLRALGPLDLRGVSAPVEAFEVIGRSGEVAVAATRFCNRVAEMARLDDAWAAGGGAFALVGEPGIGKTRVAEEFRRHVARIGGATVRSACSSFHTHTALYPVRRIVESVAEIDSRDAPNVSVPRLRTALGAIGREDLVGVFADLLGILPGEEWQPPQLDGPRLHEVTLTALVDWIEAVCAASPTLVVLDDLQWSDASTDDLIGRVLSREIKGLLLLMTAREGWEPAWAAVTTLRVGQLQPGALLDMATDLGQDLPGDALETAVERSGGVPLFLEELVRATGAEPSGLALDPDSSIPSALASPLLARLAAPGVDLALCQVLATVGREADHELVSALLGVPDDLLELRLKTLIGAHLIEAVGVEHRSYRFRHDLLRQLAYETQLRPERRRLHSAIADILDALQLPGIPPDSGAIAYHLEQADRVAEAVSAYTVDAQESLGQGAITEAIQQFDHCLELLDRVADSRRRDRLELSVRQSRAMAWVSSAGYSAPVAIDDFRRCVELCQQIGPDAGPVPSIEALWYYYTIRGELERAEEIVLGDRRRLDLGPDAIPEEGARCAIRLFRGDLTGAIADMEAFLASPYAQHAGDGVPAQWPLPDDPLVNVHSFLGLAYWLTGDAARSHASHVSARERAARLPFPYGPFGSAYAAQMELVMCRIAGLDERAAECTEELDAIAQRHGFAFFEMSAMGQRLITDARRGGEETNLEVLHSVYQMLGIGVWEPLFFLEQMAAQMRRADWAGAVATADRAIAESAQTGIRLLLAEFHRLRGDARLASGDTRGIDDLGLAAEVARAQRAVLFEMRALMRRSVEPGGDEAAGALRTLLRDLPSLDGTPEASAAGVLLGRM